MSVVADTVQSGQPRAGARRARPGDDDGGDEDLHTDHGSAGELVGVGAGSEEDLVF